VSAECGLKLRTSVEKASDAYLTAVEADSFMEFGNGFGVIASRFRRHHRPIGRTVCEVIDNSVTARIDACHGDYNPRSVENFNKFREPQMPDKYLLSSSAANLALSEHEISLIEIYQRQDSLIASLWIHFLFVNVTAMGMVILFTRSFPPGSSELSPKVGVVAICIIWAIFAYGNGNAIAKMQRVLCQFGRQIASKSGDKLQGTFTTRSAGSVLFFHSITSLFVAVFGLALILQWW
jgi:hypothetical protein